MDVLAPLVETSAAESRSRLLESAESIFADKGFDAASIREISSAAGVNLASIKYYFGDKEGLYVEAVKLAHLQTCNNEPMPEFPDRMEPQIKLELFIRGMVSRMHGPARPSAHRLMMREMAHPGRAAHVVVQEFIQPMAFRLRSIVRELFPDYSEPRILMIGFSVIGQILYYRQNRPISELIFDKPQIDALNESLVADHIVNFTFAGLGLISGGES